MPLQSLHGSDTSSAHHQGSVAGATIAAFEWFANATWSDAGLTLYAPPEAADGQYAAVSVLPALGSTNTNRDLH